jgi:uncharacterized OB-fold protein
METDNYIRTGEGRFISEEGYVPTMSEAINGLLEKYLLKIKDFNKIVYYAPDEKEHAKLAHKLGFKKEQIQDPLYTDIGNTGTAAAFTMLIAALEKSLPGDRILFAGYGDGCDTFALLVTDNITQKSNHTTLKDRLAYEIPITYGRYLDWREIIQVETANLPERSMPSLQARWRERKGISALYGVKCKKCGTPQINPIGQIVRVCTLCQSRDDFEKYKFSDKTATLLTYSVDALQPTKNPPGVNGVIDFEGGGRLMMELTDCEPDKVKIGMPLEMTFRKFQAKGILNYFWKAKPIIFQNR